MRKAYGFPKAGLPAMVLALSCILPLRPPSANGTPAPRLTNQTDFALNSKNVDPETTENPWRMQT